MLTGMPQPICPYIYIAEVSPVLNLIDVRATSGNKSLKKKIMQELEKQLDKLGSALASHITPLDVVRAARHHSSSQPRGRRGVDDADAIPQRPPAHCQRIPISCFYAVPRAVGKVPPPNISSSSVAIHRLTAEVSSSEYAVRSDERSVDRIDGQGEIPRSRGTTSLFRNVVRRSLSRGPRQSPGGHHHQYHVGFQCEIWQWSSRELSRISTYLSMANSNRENRVGDGIRVTASTGKGPMTMKRTRTNVYSDETVQDLYANTYRIDSPSAFRSWLLLDPRYLSHTPLVRM